MVVDVALLVGLRTTIAVAMPTRVEDEDIALAHLHALLYHLGGIDGKVVHLVGEVNDDARAACPLDGDFVDCFAAGEEVARAVEVGSDVDGALDVLGVDTVLGLALEILDLEGRVIGPEGGVDAERLREVVELHLSLVEELQQRVHSNSLPVQDWSVGL